MGKKWVAAAVSAPLLMSGLVACGDDMTAADSSASSSAPAADAAEAADASEPLRDQRYCEVIVSSQDKAKVVSTVFNTVGMNDCPEEEWAALTEDEVAQQYGADSVKLNGPRYWTLDEIIGSGSTTDSPTFTFGVDPGVPMQQRAVIETGINEATVGDQYYVPNEVRRDTVFVFAAGEPVFELTDPDGNVYVMQSYAQIVDPELNFEQLTDLGNRLELPEGWSYSSRVLTEQLQVSTVDTDGVAYVVNDDLLNSYQRRA